MFKLITDSATKVKIGQSCCIGSRIRYSAVTLEETRKFATLVPEDVGIFLGHIQETRYEDEFYEIWYNEVAIFPRFSKLVILDEGVLEPIE